MKEALIIEPVMLPAIVIPSNLGLSDSPTP